MVTTATSSSAMACSSRAQSPGSCQRRRNGRPSSSWSWTSPRMATASRSAPAASSRAAQPLGRFLQREHGAAHRGPALGLAGPRAPGAELGHHPGGEGRLPAPLATHEQLHSRGHQPTRPQPDRPGHRHVARQPVGEPGHEVVNARPLASILALGPAPGGDRHRLSAGLGRAVHLLVGGDVEHVVAHRGLRSRAARTSRAQTLARATPPLLVTSCSAASSASWLSHQCRPSTRSGRGSNGTSSVTGLRQPPGLRSGLGRGAVRGARPAT